MKDFTDEEGMPLDAGGGLALAEVAAEHWRTIDRMMRAVDGEGWAAGVEDASLQQVREGPDEERLLWRVGDRQLSVEGVVVETTIVNGKPTRRRVIGDEGVVSDGPIIQPGPN